MSNVPNVYVLLFDAVTVFIHDNDVSLSKFTYMLSTWSSLELSGTYSISVQICCIYLKPLTSNRMSRYFLYTGGSNLSYLKKTPKLKPAGLIAVDNSLDSR